ncbi:MAG: carbohydrate-binding module family 20 domain-containing protein, partial [Rhodothermales bacterium]|nr:carbohydrate-binding module family 20 domain-containing protein [Rhodothermales bacterium]
GIDDGDAAAVGQGGRATRRWLSDFYAGAAAPRYAEGYRFQVDDRTGEARTSGTAAALTGLQKALVERDEAAAEAALRRMLLLHGVVYFMPGIPLLYSGDELGQLNDLAYLEDPLRRDDNRWIHRPRMDWDKAERRHTAGTVEHRLFHGLRRLADVRRARPALHGEARAEIVVPESDGLFVVHRHRRGRHLLLAANFGRTWQQTPLEGLPPAYRSGHARDVLAGERLHFSTGTLAVPPYGCLWLEPMGPPAAPAALVPVPLRLYVETVYGEAVYVSGSVEALGMWRPEAAAGPLDPAEYPFWTGEVMVPAGTVFAYRWLKKRGADVVAGSPEAFVGVARARPGP